MGFLMQVLTVYAKTTNKSVYFHLPPPSEGEDKGGGVKYD